MEEKVKSNKEILAISRILRLLEGLSAETKIRILNYILAHSYEEREKEVAVRSLGQMNYSPMMPKGPGNA